MKYFDYFPKKYEDLLNKVFDKPPKNVVSIAKTKKKQYPSMIYSNDEENAFLMLHFFPGVLRFINWVVVDPELHGKGIGSKLVNEVFNEDNSWVYLTISRDTDSFWERNGFYLFKIHSGRKYYMKTKKTEETGLK